MRVRNCFLNLPFLKSLHLKIFSVPRRQILGQRVLNPADKQRAKSPFCCTLVLQTKFTVAHTFTRSTVSFTNQIHCCSHFHTINYLSIILLLTVPPNLFLLEPHGLWNFPDQGWNPSSLQCKGRVLTPGPLSPNLRNSVTPGPDSWNMLTFSLVRTNTFVPRSPHYTRSLTLP